MKFTVIFSFFAVVAACFMLPISEAGIAVRDTDAMSSLIGTGATLMSGFVKGMGDTMNSMMDAGKTVGQTVQTTATDGMKEMTKDLQSFVPGSDSKGAAADSKTDKKQ